MSDDTQASADSLATVQRLAEMTRIRLAPEEATKLATDMDAILDHVAKLQECDTSGVSITSGITGLHDVARLDVIEPSLTPEEVLANAPERHDGFFVVPAVLGD